MLKSIPFFPQCAVISDADDAELPLIEDLLRLESLRLLVIGPFWLRSEDLWSATLQILTNLHELRVTERPTDFPELDAEDISSPEFSLLPSLRVLKIGYSEFGTTFPPTTSNTLKTLVLHEQQALEASLFIAFIRHHTTSLRRVCLTDVDFIGDEQNPLDEIGLYAPNLKYLYIHLTYFMSKAILPGLPLSLVEASLDFSREFIEPDAFRDFSRKHASGVPSTLKSLALEMPVPKGAHEWQIQDEGVFEPEKWEIEWIQIQKDIEDLGVTFVCTIRHSGGIHDLRPLGSWGPLDVPFEEDGTGPGRRKNPVWSLL